MSSTVAHEFSKVHGAVTQRLRYNNLGLLGKHISIGNRPQYDYITGRSFDHRKSIVARFVKSIQAVGVRTECRS